MIHMYVPPVGLAAELGTWEGCARVHVHHPLTSTLCARNHVQTAMHAHAPDVLYEATSSRVGDHLLRLVATAVKELCVPAHRGDKTTWRSHGVSYDDSPPKRKKKNHRRR